MVNQYSIQKMVSDGSLDTIILGIQYLQRDDIYIRIAGVDTPPSGGTNGYTWAFINNTTIRVTPVIPVGAEVIVYRRTDINSMYNVYSQNAQFDEATIDENNQQLLYITQEYLEQGIPGAGVDTIEYLRDDGSYTYYRVKRTDGSYSDEFAVPSTGSTSRVISREAIRRSCAIAGFTLVDGSFQVGFLITSKNDVVIDEADGKIFTGLVGSYPPNTSTVGFTDVSNRVMYTPFSGYADTAQYTLDDARNSGMTVVLANGTHNGLTLKNGSLRGQGYSSVVKDGSGGYAIKVKSFMPHWRRQYIKDVQFTAQTTLSGIGLTYDPDDIVAGRWNVEYAGFTGFDVCIKKPQGNIGNLFNSLYFTTSNYGYKSTDGTLGTMHSGCDRFSECYWLSIQKWCVDIECKTDGGGAIIIENSIMEQCNGGGVRIDLGGKVPYTPVVLRNLWFEQVCKAATVERDGVVEIPRQVKLVNSPIVHAEFCYLTNVELVNSTLLASKCRVDDASGTAPTFVVDSSSNLELCNLYANGTVGGVPLVTSVAAQKAQAQSRNLSLRGLPVVDRIVKPQSGTIRAKNAYDGTPGTTTWSFPGTVSTRTAQCIADGLTNYSCAELIIAAGETQLSTDTAVITSGKWYVWGISTRLISGNGSFKFEDTLSLGEIYVKQGEWVSTFGIAKAGVSGNVKLRLSGTTSVTIRMKDYFVAEFDTEKEALAFCNTRAALS